jgi:hypothetical protein
MKVRFKKIWKWAATCLAGFTALAVLVGLVIYFLAQMFCPAPGNDDRARSAMLDAKPVIAALNRYHQEKKSYPKSLSELIPKYLSESDYSAIVEKEFMYMARGGDYELTYRYVGPGINACTYRPESGEWKCHGHY